LYILPTLKSKLNLSTRQQWFERLSGDWWTGEMSLWWRDTSDPHLSNKLLDMRC